jgi:hypothetical protein
MRIASARERGDARSQGETRPDRESSSPAAAALLVGTVFVTLLVTIDNQRDAAALSRHSQQVLWRP